MKWFGSLVLLLVSLIHGWADGGAILARETIDGWNLTVFAAPFPVRAGPVDVSVLVQDATTGQSILDATVAVGWTANDPTQTADWLPPCCSMDTVLGNVPAIRAHSQNKLLYGAILPVRSVGPSEIKVSVHRDTQNLTLVVPVDVAPPRAPALTYWPLLAFPPLVMGIFALHQKLKKRGP